MIVYHRRGLTIVKKVIIAPFYTYIYACFTVKSTGRKLHEIKYNSTFAREQVHHP
jgi:hypothetical protein